LINQFLKDRTGTTSVEFTLVALVFFLIFFGIIDIGRMMYAWNGAAKATHWGTRFAIVSDPVARGLANFDCLVAAGGNGEPCPLNAVNPNPVVCNSSGCNGYGPFDGAAFNAIVRQMRAIDDTIQAADIVVEYRHIGISMAGNPVGPDITPAVTIRLQNTTFNFITPGLSGIASVTMPEFTTTMTAEDLAG